MTTTKRTVDWVDAFTAVPFGGNGCAVVHNAGELSDATCMAFTRETSLVECTFLEPSQIADVKVRYFLASGEIPFAGHPTIATAASLYHQGKIGLGQSTFETGAGVVPVELSEPDGRLLVQMTQVAPIFGGTVATDRVAKVMGLAEDDIVATPQNVSTGLPFWIVLVKDRETIERAVLNEVALTEMIADLGAREGMMEPYLITMEGATERGDTFSRLLLPPPSPPEDPFTGSATGAAAAYLWANGHAPTPTWVAEQGHGMGRPGEALVEVLGPREAITGVRVSGAAHVLMSGSLYL